MLSSQKEMLDFFFSFGQRLSIQVARFKEAGGKRRCLCALRACSQPTRLYVMASGGTLDPGRRGIQPIHMELLLVQDELLWDPKRREALRLPRAAAVTGSPQNRNFLSSL